MSLSVTFLIAPTKYRQKQLVEGESPDYFSGAMKTPLLRRLTKAARQAGTASEPSPVSHLLPKPCLLILFIQLHSWDQVLRHRNLWEPFSFQHHRFIWVCSWRIEAAIAGKAREKGVRELASVHPQSGSRGHECCRSACFFLCIPSGDPFKADLPTSVSLGNPSSGVS